MNGMMFPDPNKIIEQLWQQRAQTMTQGTPQQQRNQNVETALDAVFGNPVVVRQQRAAQQIKNAEKASLATLPEGASDIDKEMARIRAQRDAAVDLDPNLASQLNMRLLQLGNMRLEQDKLKAEEKRAEGRFGMDSERFEREQAMDTLLGGRYYVFDPQTGTAESFNLKDEAQQPRFSQAAQRDGTIVITPDQALQLYRDRTDQSARMRVAISNAKGGDLSKMPLKNALEATDGLLGLYATSDRILDVISQNPTALTNVSAAATALDKLSTEFKAIGSVGLPNGRTADGTQVDDWFKANSITNTRMQGLIVGLAYAQAKAVDPGGRVTDKDLIAATNMVGGGNPDPRAVLANMNDTLATMTMRLTDSIDTLPEGYQINLKARRDLIDKKRAAWDEKFGKWTTGSRSAAAGTPIPAMGSGPTPAPPAQGSGGQSVTIDIQTRDRLLNTYGPRRQ